MIKFCAVADLFVTPRAPDFKFTKTFIRYSVVDCKSMCSDSSVTFNGKILKYILLRKVMLYKIQMTGNFGILITPLHACGFQWNHKMSLVHTWLEVVKFTKLLPRKPCWIFSLPCTPWFLLLYFLGFMASILWVVEVASPLYALQEHDNAAFDLDSVFLWLHHICLWERLCYVCCAWVFTSVV